MKYTLRLLGCRKLNLKYLPTMAAMNEMHGVSAMDMVSRAQMLGGHGYALQPRSLTYMGDPWSTARTTRKEAREWAREWQLAAQLAIEREQSTLLHLAEMEYMPTMLWIFRKILLISKKYKFSMVLLGTLFFVSRHIVSHVYIFSIMDLKPIDEIRTVKKEFRYIQLALY